jgi:hypothetical protein
MAKNGHFVMEFWPAFDIFHRLRPYLCSKREVLGFHKQATHRRPGDEPFFTLWSTVHDWGWPKNGPFWTKNGQTWQACQRFKVVQKGLKGTKMVNLSVFDHLGPFWANLDPFGPFQTKINFWPQMDKVGFGGGASEQKINFCLKWSKRVQGGPKGSQMIKNT